MDMYIDSKMKFMVQLVRALRQEGTIQHFTHGEFWDSGLKEELAVLYAIGAKGVAQDIEKAKELFQTVDHHETRELYSPIFHDGTITITKETDELCKTSIDDKTLDISVQICMQKNLHLLQSCRVAFDLEY